MDIYCHVGGLEEKVEWIPVLEKYAKKPPVYYHWQPPDEGGNVLL